MASSRKSGPGRGKPSAWKSAPRKAGPKRAGPTKPGVRPPPARPPVKLRRSPAKKKRAIKVTAINAPAPASDSRMRLNRYLATSGVCSRRAADEYITRGRVMVNGEITTELGTRVDPGIDEVHVDGLRIQPEPKVYILFNKPKEVVCTNARNEQRRRVIDYLPQVRGRVYTVGRLDAESEGLIIVTNDGDFAQHVAHPSFGLAKTYAVLVEGRVTDESLKKARGGVWLSEGRTTGARIVVEKRGRERSYLKVSIKEGRNREIRRIFAKIEHPVISLKRVRIGGLSLHGLGSGRWRFLQLDEVRALLTITNRQGEDE